jgi:hypothetical protein
MFFPEAREQKEYVYSKIERLGNSDLSTLYIEITADVHTAAFLHRELSHKAYGLLAQTANEKLIIAESAKTTIARVPE